MYVNDSGKILPYTLSGDLWMRRAGTVVFRSGCRPDLPGRPVQCEEAGGIRHDGLGLGQQVDSQDENAALDRELCLEQVDVRWRLAGWGGIVSQGENAGSRAEADVTSPSTTPVFVMPCGWMPGRRKDRPAANVLEGDSGLNAGMSRIVLARHGTGQFPGPAEGARLPGSINLVFADGHSQDPRSTSAFGTSPPAQELDEWSSATAVVPF